MLRAATQARTSGGDSPRASNPHATNPSTAKSIAHRNGNPKFSLFQKLVRQWDEIHPYNAIHVLKVRGQYDLQASRAAWHDALEVLGMGRVNIAGDSFFHECLNGDSIQHTVEPCPPGVTLHAWISRELNRPFCPIDAVPFRPFVIQEPDFFWMGLVYQHWVADSASIREVMREWFVRQYDPRAGRTKPRPWMGGYLALFGPQRSGLEMADGLLAALRSTSQFRRVRRIEDPEMFQDLSAAFMPIPSHPGLIDALRQSARRHGVTVNDFFLAGIAEAANELVPVPRRYRRQDLAVATIVNLRPKVHRPMCDAFGLLLGFTSVCCKPKQLEHWDSLLHSVSAQMRRQKLAGSAQSSWLRLMVGWWAETRWLARRRSSDPSRWDGMELSPAATMQRSFALRRDPQPSFTPQCPTSAWKREQRSLEICEGRSDKRGCIGRLRSRLSAKLLRIPPPQAGNSLFLVPSKMPPRTSPGQPAGFAAVMKYFLRRIRRRGIPHPGQALRLRSAHAVHHGVRRSGAQSHRADDEGSQK
jgi:hypothetical protein